MASNALGYINKGSDIGTLTLNNSPVSSMIAGEVTVTGKTTNAGQVKFSLVGSSTLPLKLPQGSKVIRADIQVVEAPTPATADAACTISVGTDLLNKAACFNSAEAIASWPGGDGVIFGNATAYSTSKTASETVILNITSATGTPPAFTAGKFKVFLYLVSA